MQIFKSFKKVAEKLIMSPCQKLYFLFIVIAWSVSSSNVWKAGIFRYDFSKCWYCLNAQLQNEFQPIASSYTHKVTTY